MKIFNIFFLTLELILSINIANAYVFEDIVEQVNEAVVCVNVKTNDGEQAMGAGVIIDKEGFIVTNTHVTEKAKEITIITTSNDIYKATLIGTDTKTDIALVKVSDKLNINPALFGNSDDVRVGNRVFAIGNPYGLGNSISMGIISAKERDIEKGPYDSFLQTDAAINQGNSGGPLFSLKGEIVGINTAIFSTNGENMGLGFATPANIVKWVVNQLKHNNKVIRGWLGITVNTIHAKDGSSRLAITSMGENTPAAKAGLKVGDIIQEAGELSLDNPRVFSLGIAKMKPGNVLPIIIERDGKVLDFSVVLDNMPDENIISSTQIKKDKLKFLGIDEEKIKEAVYFKQLGIKAYFDDINKEMVIVDIEDTSDLATKGIKKGDKFSIIDGKKIFGIEDLRIKIKEALSKGIMNITFMQNGDIDNVTVKIIGE